MYDRFIENYGDEKMKMYLIFLLIITTIFIFITLYVVFSSKDKRSENTNICGVLWAMISVFVTLLISIISYQSDNIDIIFKDGRTMEIEDLNSLSLDKEGLKLSNNTSPDYLWYINLCNNGNITSKNIKVKISFDNIIFEENPDYYSVTDGRYSIGGYRSLLYDVSDIILPDNCVSLPIIDFIKSCIDKDLDSDKMTIYIYSENNKLIKKEYMINLNEKNG